MTDQTSSAVTFAQIKQLVERGTSDGKLITAADHVISLAMWITSVALGPAGAVVLSWLEPKNQLVDLAKAAARKIAGKRGGDFLERSRRIATAHFLITYSAFFDALNRTVPELMTRVALTSEEKQLLVTERLRATGQDMDAIAISAPHPALGPQAEEAARRARYEQLTQRFAEFVDGLELGDPRKPPELANVPAVACESYQAQYLELAMEYPRFYAWATLTELATVRDQAARLSDDFARQLTAVADLSEHVDIGLRALAGTIRDVGVGTSTADAPDQVAQELHLRYAAELARPIIDDRYAEPGEVAVGYPAKSDIFVPQAFQTVRYPGTELRLENEQLWRSIPVDDGLGAFLVRYLQSPYSTETPLLVLGHPGSGKSLLTEIVAGRLAPPHFHPVRVELRDIKPDTGLQSQLEDQIRLDTGRTINWPTFAEGLADSPPLVILDGYDELLQASGRVFADYLNDVARFQWREALFGRPIRVLVTSRITLIDKAAIPPGTTVLRLRGFDESRRRSWTEVWNRHNEPYFAATGTRRFELPDRPEVVDLAGQPLLLLMLALYDSQANQLHEHAVLDRSLLYHSLLTRFIRRERGKGESAAEFATLTPAEQDEQLETDLERLGVAAIGMFNRRNVHVTRDELDADVAYFDVSRDVAAGGGSRLTQADLLLGSFFFIHESRHRSGDRAFEFLHNTFGEFLAADFLLRQLIRETAAITQLSGTESLRSVLADHLRALPDALLACLVHTPLPSRPVVFEMLREWAPHRLAKAGRDPGEFVAALETLTRSQLTDLLDGVPPAIVRSGPYPTRSVLDHQAVYTLNLVLLRAALAVDGWTFTEPAAGRSWDQLTHLWRAWLSMEELIEFAAVVRVRRDGPEISIRPNDRVVSLSRGTALDDVYIVAQALGDDVTAGLAGLALHQTASVPEIIEPGFLADRLAASGVDVRGLARMLEARRRPDRLTATTQPLTDWLNRYPVERPDWLAAGLSIAAESLRQRVPVRAFRVEPNDPADILALPRHQARLVIEVKSRLELRWLDDVHSRLSVPDSATDFLRMPAAAPLLWAGVERSSRGRAELMADLVANSERIVGQVDAETAVALTALAAAANETALHRVGDAALAAALPRGEFTLSERALAHLTDCADGVPHEVREALTAATDSLFDEFSVGSTVTDPTDRLRIAIVCRFRSERQRAFLRSVLDTFHKSHLSVWLLGTPGLLLLVRAVRMVNQQESTRMLVQVLRRVSQRLPGRREALLQVFGLAPFRAHAGRLTLREIDDLRWFASRADDHASMKAIRDALHDLGQPDGGRRGR